MRKQNIEYCLGAQETSRVPFWEGVL